MNSSFENETWIIDAGDEVIRKMAAGSESKLSSKEMLIYCLWVVDYCMQNAGDLNQASDMHPGWQREAIQLAKELHLDYTYESFSLTESSLQQQYFSRFDSICNEIKHA
jgi:hypothetical protein